MSSLEQQAPRAASGRSLHEGPRDDEGPPQQRRRRSRVLVVTQIFPNETEPEYAPYNRQQFAALSRRCDVEVLATVPWFPGARATRRWTRAGRLMDLPRGAEIDGLHVRHPRYLQIPKVPSLLGPLYAASLAKIALEYRGWADVVLGSYAYPDGFAAIALAGLLSVPAVVKLHGGDLDVTATLPGPRRWLRWMLPRAAGVVAVSEPLAKAAAALGVARDRIHVVQNGIDRSLFRPGDRLAARAQLRRPAGRRLVLYVGRLERDKGVLDLLAAFGELCRARNDVDLVMAGNGAAAAECARVAAAFDRRVTLLGAAPLEEVACWMTACDALALPSWHEGTPNVLIEAQAAGRRVVATNVGGIPAVVRSAELGELVPPHRIDQLAAALDRVVYAPYDPAAIAAACERGDWSDSARRLEAVLRGALAPTR